MRNQLRAIFNDLFRRKEKITPAKIKRIFQGNTASLSLLSGFTLYMADSRSDSERNLRKSTWWCTIMYARNSPFFDR